MPRFKVTQDYRSNGVGPLVKGESVELDAETAAFVDRDSPGTLTPALGEPTESADDGVASRRQRPRHDRAVR